MSKVEIFDPAMCCPTGVCGPSVNPELSRVASAIFLLEKKGFDIKRYNLGTEPAVFVSNSEVNRVLHEKGPDSLPVTLVDGIITKIGVYPSNEEFAKWFGIDAEELAVKQKANLKIDLKPMK
ncbi:arsenite efflux transporter metallochaperone ArsD [Bacillus sp. T33-2]|uniref:arsenite efflux transporter metallochaperone ArsD n=1 Tax=Bacillus sp. T33-2 TaxID=2054168 RepID=UPI000C756924|nr:arsenite efflux transporter metallochaperone ArsD [Bacillus sp. T33-2]PLR95512.1 arsenical resistance operon transcriptional repressor ArsD [Bacillus sp. T33-2]